MGGSRRGAQAEENCFPNSIPATIVPGRDNTGAGIMAIARALIGVALLFFCVPAGAFSEKRVALVVGNSAYENAGRLENPLRDAKAVAAALREAGFAEVTEGYDLTKPQFDAALKRFGDAASGADWALVYFAGHGIGVGGESYLLQVDAVLERPEHVEDEAIALARIRAKAGGAKALRLVILDSCRNNPFAARMAALGGKRAISRGLARPAEPESGELIAYATRENDVADDGNGSHSPFTAAFLQHVGEPGLEVNFLCRRIRSSVLKATKGGQDPAIYASLSDTQLFFVAPSGEKPEPGEAKAPLGEAARAWADIKDLKDIAVFEAFRKQYGAANPLYDTLAGQRIAELNRAQLAVAKPAFSFSAPHPLETAPPVMQNENNAEHLIRTFTGHADSVTSVAFSPDGRTLASGSGDTTLKLWDVSNGHELRSLTGHTGWVDSVAFSPDGRTLASGSKDYTIKLWDLASSRKPRTLTGTKMVTSVTFSPDGSTLASAGYDNTVKLWDVASGGELRTLSGRTNGACSVAFSPDGRALASVGLSDGKTVKLWDVASGRELRTLTGHMNIVRSVAFSPDGQTLASGSGDQTVKLWDVSEWTQPREARR